MCVLFTLHSYVVRVCTTWQRTKTLAKYMYAFVTVIGRRKLNASIRGREWLRIATLCACECVCVCVCVSVSVC